MAFAVPKFSRNQINQAGEILVDYFGFPARDQQWADTVLANWRACHGYPINTFQATLRTKLRRIDRQAIVAQRLKRAPSIVLKLQRFNGMQLARMQDIGGLRAVVSSVHRLDKLHQAYRHARFEHELHSFKDYVTNPKADGYRSIHLIFRYMSRIAPDYNGLSLELQLRTRLQHAWATAVETMGTFLGQALKSGQGESEWRTFFAVAGAALAVLEHTPAVPGYENCSREHVFLELAKTEKKLRVLERLRGFAIAADRITKGPGSGAYHLIVLDSAKRTVEIRPYPISRLEEANLDYAVIEQRTKAGEPIEAVLVSAGPIEQMKKAYPNYFLDTQEFVLQIERIISQARKHSAYGIQGDLFQR